MKRAGFFVDYPNTFRVGQAVRQHANRLDLSLQAIIAGYLEGGRHFIRVLDNSAPDVIAPSRTVRIGVLTDGEWIWPADYGHYVQHYAVEVPIELIKKIESHQGLCPEVSKDDLARIGREYQSWGMAVDPHFAQSSIPPKGA